MRGAPGLAATNASEGTWHVGPGRLVASGMARRSIRRTHTFIHEKHTRTCRTSINTRTYIDAHNTNIHTCIRNGLYTKITHICARARARARTHTHTHTQTHAYTHTHKHIHTYTCTYAPMHKRTYAHTHTHTHTHTRTDHAWPCARAPHRFNVRVHLTHKHTRMQTHNHPLTRARSGTHAQCTHVHTHTHMRVHAHLQRTTIFIYMHACAFDRVCTHTHARTHARTRTTTRTITHAPRTHTIHRCTQLQNTHVCTHQPANTHTRVAALTYMHAKRMYGDTGTTGVMNNACRMQRGGLQRGSVQI